MFNASGIFSDKTSYPRLAIFVKEPNPGSVKTRLAKDLGTINATKWYRDESRKTINRLTRDPRWETYLAVSPDHTGLLSRVWPEKVKRISQGTGHLGQRMKNIFRQLHPGPTIIIGSDIPGIKPSQITRAVNSIGKCDVYIAPSPDGGFWLIGLKGKRSLPSKAFENVRWSTEYAMEDTINSLGRISLGIGEEMSDVDTLADLLANPHTHR